MVKPAFGLGEAQITDMLKAGYEHASEDMLARQLGEARVEAEALLDGLLAAMTTERDHAEARMKEVAGEFQEIKAEYETMKAEFDQAKETVETQKKLLEGYIKSACLLEEKLGAANEKVDQFDDLSKRFDPCKAEGLKWKTESEGCQAKIQQMSEQMNSQLEASKEVQKMVQVMRSRTNQSVAQLKEEKDRAEKAEAELKAIKEMMSKKEMEFMQLNDSYAAACDENETLQKDLQKKFDLYLLCTSTI